MTGAVIASGTGATSSSGNSGTINWKYHSVQILIKATADAVVKVNGFSCKFLAAVTEYTVLPVDVTEITIVSGTIDYIVVG